MIGSSRQQHTSADYFLAGRNVGWFAIGGSLFASNIGSEHIVGLAGSGAMSGMAMAHWEMHAWIMLMLGWIFVPFYYRANVFTMPEFLEKRFNSRVRLILSMVSLVAYVFTKVSVTVYAGALVFRTLLPDLEVILFGQVWGPFWLGAFATVMLTGIYTVFGGFRAVLYTDSVQALLLIIGSASITLIGLDALGGWNELVRMHLSGQTNCLWRHKEKVQVCHGGKIMISRGWELSSLHRLSAFGIGVLINTSCSEPSLQKISQWRGAAPSGEPFSKSGRSSSFYCLGSLGGRYIKKEFFIFR